jgi:hypothetical protein
VNHPRIRIRNFGKNARPCSPAKKSTPKVGFGHKFRKIVRRFRSSAFRGWGNNRQPEFGGLGGRRRPPGTLRKRIFSANLRGRLGTQNFDDFGNEFLALRIPQQVNYSPHAWVEAFRAECSFTKPNFGRQSASARCFLFIEHRWRRL